MSIRQEKTSHLFHLAFPLFWMISHLCKCSLSTDISPYIDCLLWCFAHFSVQFSFSYWCLSIFWASLVVQAVKNLPATWETCVQSLGWEYPLEKEKDTHPSILAWGIPGDKVLEKEMATHSSILARKIPWTEEPGGAPWGHKRVGYNWATKQEWSLVLSFWLLTVGRTFGTISYNNWEKF